MLTNSTGERRSRSTLGESPAAAGTGVWTRTFRLRATPFLIAEKWGKDAPGDHSIKVPRTPPHGQGGSAPIGSPTFGQETGDSRSGGDERRGTGGLDGGNGLPHALRGFAMTMDGGPDERCGSTAAMLDADSFLVPLCYHILHHLLQTHKHN